MQQINAGNLIPLDDFADSKFKEDWLLGWDTLIYDGKKMALPYEYRAPVLYYRSDWMDGKKPPQSWDEMLRMANEMADDQRSGVIIGLSRGSQAQALSEVILSYFWDMGVELFDADGKAAFNTEQGYAVFERIANLVKEGFAPDAVISYTYEEVFQSLKAGTGVFTFLGSHRAEAARAAADLKGKLMIAPLPGMKGGNEPAPAHVFGWTLAISKDSKNPEAAWKFIEFMTNPDTQLHQVKLTGELPSRKSPYDDEFFNSEEGKELRELADYMQTYGRTSQYSEYYTQMTEFWADAMQEIILNNAPVKQAVDNAAEKYNALIK